MIVIGGSGSGKTRFYVKPNLMQMTDHVSYAVSYTHLDVYKRQLYNYCVNMPDIPSVDMSFSESNVKAYVEGNSQRTSAVSYTHLRSFSREC